MARRGFFEEIVYQSQVSAREQARRQQAAIRESNAVVRRAEQARRVAESARVKLTRATEAERRRTEKEVREAHIAEMEANAEDQNQRLADVCAEIDSLLASTLEKDDYVDLETFRLVALHPPFSHSKLEVPIPVPDRIPEPPQPTFVPPDPPRGLAKIFGKKKYLATLAEANATHERSVAEWRAELERMPARRQKDFDAHAEAENKRLAALRIARVLYGQECEKREAAAAVHNRQLDDLIANLGYGTPEAIKEYISIVLSKSVYPEQFPVNHEFEFEPSSAELKLRCFVPPPNEMPEIKAYKYTKSTDEITTTPLSQKVCRDRYASAIHQVALRSIHEVFESDRRGLIKTISLQVGTNTVDPATGRQAYMPFVVVGAERESFLKFNLSAVIPEHTLGRLGAAVSKNPYIFEVVETSGVRRS